MWIKKMYLEGKTQKCLFKITLKRPNASFNIGSYQITIAVQKKSISISLPHAEARWNSQQGGSNSGLLKRGEIRQGMRINEGRIKEKYSKEFLCQFNNTIISKIGEKGLIFCIFPHLWCHWFFHAYKLLCGSIDYTTWICREGTEQLLSRIIKVDGQKLFSVLVSKGTINNCCLLILGCTLTAYCIE